MEDQRYTRVVNLAEKDVGQENVSKKTLQSRMKQQGAVAAEDLVNLAGELDKIIEDKNLQFKKEVTVIEDKNKEEMKTLMQTFF
jgi:hypothetical protein